MSETKELNLVVLSVDQFNELRTNGTITVNGVTITYNEASTMYATPSDLIVDIPKYYRHFLIVKMTVRDSGDVILLNFDYLSKNKTAPTWFELLDYFQNEIFNVFVTNRTNMGELEYQGFGYVFAENRNMLYITSMKDTDSFDSSFTVSDLEVSITDKVIEIK